MAVGEVGIDYKTKVKKKVEWEVYERVLLMAKAADKPVIIHFTLSHARTFEMTRDGRNQKGRISLVYG